jgi:hypothetical protein
MFHSKDVNSKHFTNVQQITKGSYMHHPVTKEETTDSKQLHKEKLLLLKQNFKLSKSLW